MQLFQNYENGWEMSGGGKGIEMNKKGRNLMFDIVVRNGTELVCCLY